MHARRASLIVAIVGTAPGAIPAVAQPFAEVSNTASEEMVGPQNVPGRRTRTQTPDPAAPPSAGPAEPAEPAEDPGEPEPEREWFGHRDWHHWDRMTGDWSGLRTNMEASGLTIAASYTGEWFGVVSGGARRHGAVRGFLDVNATLDLGTAVGWDGATVFADAYWIDGNSISEHAGDFQGVSNAEAEDRLQLAELWYEHVLLDGSLRFKVGKIEANAEFAFVDAAGDFVNSSAGFSPTIVGIPSYPDPAFGVVLSWSPGDRFSLTGAVFDGASAVDGVRTGTRGPKSFFDDDLSDDYFWIAQADYAWDGGRAGVGVWHHTGDFERFTGGTVSGTTGLYALGEHRVWSPEEGRGIDLVAQFGWADDAVSEAEWHLGVGAAWNGPWSARPDDAAGLYVSHVGLSDDAGFTDDETVFECFYRFQITPWASVKPDMQYIVRPGGSSDIDDALVVGVRFEISF